MRLAMTVTGKGDKLWHHELVALNIAVFPHFALGNTERKNGIFSLIEILRGKLDTPVPLLPDACKAFDEGPLPPKADGERGKYSAKR